MKKQNYYKWIFLVLTLSSISFTEAAIVYVRKSATGANNGTSWTNAYKDLSTALVAAASGSDIYISADTFYLPAGAGRSVAYTIQNKSLNIYGGFPATGNPSFSNRNISLYKTIISGDVNKNDGSVSITTSHSATDRSDNAYHVFVITQGNSNYSVLFHGVIIEGGNASGNGNDGKGAAVYYTRNINGTGNITHSLRFINCEFRNNTAKEAAIFYSNYGFVKCDYVGVQFIGNNIHHNNADLHTILSTAPSANVNIDYTIACYYNLLYKNASFNSSSSLIFCTGNENNASNSNFQYGVHFNTFANNKLGQNDGSLLLLEGPKLTSAYNSVSVSNNVAQLNDVPLMSARSGKSKFQTYIIDNNFVAVTDSFIIKYSGGNDQLISQNVFKNSAADNYQPNDCSVLVNAGKSEILYPDRTNIQTLSLPVNLDAYFGNRINHNTIDVGAIEYTGSKFPIYNSMSAQLCYGETIEFNGNTVATAGEYTAIKTATNGCDSFVILKLTIADSLKARIGIQYDPGTAKTYVGSKDASNNIFNSYKWYINDTLVQGQNQFFIERSKFGKYYAIVTKNVNGKMCTSQSPDYIYSNPNQNNKMKAIELHDIVYPNPAQNVISWKLKNLGMVQVVDINGRILIPFKKANHQLDISTLQSGIYGLQFENVYGVVRIVKY